MLSEEILKQIYFLSDKPRKDALLADEVDIIQFGQNVAAHAAHLEHQRCCEIARSYNTAVAELLESKKP